MRQVADMAFLLHQYDFAAQTYRLAAQDYLANNNNKWYAGVEVRAQGRRRQYSLLSCPAPVLQAGRQAPWHRTSWLRGLGCSCLRAVDRAASTSALPPPAHILSPAE